MSPPQRASRSFQVDHTVADEAYDLPRALDTDCGEELATGSNTWCVDEWTFFLGAVPAQAPLTTLHWTTCDLPGSGATDTLSFMIGGVKVDVVNPADDMQGTVTFTPSPTYPLTFIVRRSRIEHGTFTLPARAA